MRQIRFARVLFGVQIVVRVIAENSGLNATEVIGQLKAAHASGQAQAGLDIESGQPKDLSAAGIVDLFSAKVSFKFRIHPFTHH